MVKAWFDMIVARPAINNSQLEMKIEGCCATFAPCPRHAWTVSVGEIKKWACLQRLYKKSWSVVAKPLLLHLLKSATLLKSQSVAAQTAKNAIFLVWTDFLPCVG